MQRVVGCIMILVGSTGMGVLCSAELQRYLEKLQYIRQIVYMLNGEMEYTRAPLGEVAGRLALRVKEPYSSWMRALERQIARRADEDFAKIWDRSIDKYLKDLHLKEHHLEQLKELGTQLGRMDSKTGNGTVTLYLDQMELEIKKVREGLATKKRLCNCLGVMGGIFLVVVLI